MFDIKRGPLIVFMIFALVLRSNAKYYLSYPSVSCAEVCAAYGTRCKSVLDICTTDLITHLCPPTSKMPSVGQYIPCDTQTCLVNCADATYSIGYSSVDDCNQTPNCGEEYASSVCYCETTTTSIVYVETDGGIEDYFYSLSLFRKIGFILFMVLSVASIMILCYICGSSTLVLDRLTDEDTELQSFIRNELQSRHTSWRWCFCVDVAVTHLQHLAGGGGSCACACCGGLCGDQREQNSRGGRGRAHVISASASGSRVRQAIAHSWSPSPSPPPSADYSSLPSASSHNPSPPPPTATMSSLSDGNKRDVQGDVEAGGNAWGRGDGGEYSGGGEGDAEEGDVQGEGEGHDDGWTGASTSFTSSQTLHRISRESDSKNLELVNIKYSKKSQSVVNHVTDSRPRDSGSASDRKMVKHSW